VIEMSTLPPRWVDVTDEVQERLSVVSRKSALLDRLHAKHVLPGFDDDARGGNEGEIERLTAEITGEFHTCQNLIQKVAGVARGGGMAEEQMAKNLMVAMAGKVQEASTGFRKKQAAYLKSMDPSSPGFRGCV
jgi:syntaxin 16